MENRNFLILICTIIVLVAALTLALKTCNDKKKAPKSADQLTIDSLISEQYRKDSIYSHTVILLNNSIASARFKSDSLSTVVSSRTTALEKSKATVAFLIAKGPIINKDSIQQQLDNCDSIKREAIYLTENISDYQRAQETLMENNRALLATMQRTSQMKDSAYQWLKNDFNFLANKYSQLDHNYLNSKKQVNKRFGLSLFGGYTYIVDKFRPVAGIGISYTLIKF